ncbi:MAG TPA: CAP domain-containing protein [Gaiellaceae bacterium]|nr:CAP domain-containing protein [Gaiellaceae bacterium]
MRTIVATGALSILLLGCVQQAVARPLAMQVPRQRTVVLFTKRAAAHARPVRPAGPRNELALQRDVVARINEQRAARGLKPLRVSLGLTAAARYHSREMGLHGFFEHESLDGAPFWKRIARFYPLGQGSWAVGENIFYESPDTTARSAVHEWMMSAPHRQNILSPEWREIGIGAAHFASAGGTYAGGSVTIVTADFGARG